MGNPYLAIDSGPRFSEIQLNDSGNLLIFKNKFIDYRTGLGDLGALKAGQIANRGFLSFSHQQYQDAGGGNRQYGLYSEKPVSSLESYDASNPTLGIPTSEKAHLMFGGSHPDSAKYEVTSFDIDSSGRTLYYQPSDGPNKNLLLQTNHNWSGTSDLQADRGYLYNAPSKTSPINVVTKIKSSPYIERW